MDPGSCQNINGIHKFRAVDRPYIHMYTYTPIYTYIYIYTHFFIYLFIWCKLHVSRASLCNYYARCECTPSGNFKVFEVVSLSAQPQLYSQLRSITVHFEPAALLYSAYHRLSHICIYIHMYLECVYVNLYTYIDIYMYTYMHSRYAHIQAFIHTCLGSITAGA